MEANKSLELARKAYPNDKNLRVAYILGIQKGAEFAERTMIDKACELLARMIWEVTYENLEGNSVQHYDKMEFIEDFCKAMKGE